MVILEMSGGVCGWIFETMLEDCEWLGPLSGALRILVGGMQKFVNYFRQSFSRIVLLCGLGFAACVPAQKEPQPQPENGTSHKSLDQACLKKCLQESMAHAVAWEVIEERCQRQCSK